MPQVSAYMPASTTAQDGNTIYFRGPDAMEQYHNWRRSKGFK